MGMNVELFNFLEDYREQVVQLMVTKIPKEIKAYARVSRTELKETMDHMLDGYIDLLVTGQPEAIEKVFRYVVRVRHAQKFQISEVLATILMLTPVIRRLLAEEYRDIQGDDALRKFNAALEQIESNANRAACLFTDIFQDHLNKRIKEHNDYLDQAQKKFGIDLSRFIVFKA
jgi:hypothetical protein